MRALCLVFAAKLCIPCGDHRSPAVSWAWRRAGWTPSRFVYCVEQVSGHLHILLFALVVSGAWLMVQYWWHWWGHVKILSNLRTESRLAVSSWSKNVQVHELPALLDGQHLFSPLKYQHNVEGTAQRVRDTGKLVVTVQASCCQVIRCGAEPNRGRSSRRGFSISWMIMPFQGRQDKKGSSDFPITVPIYGISPILTHRTTASQLTISQLQAPAYFIINLWTRKQDPIPEQFKLINCFSTSPERLRPFTPASSEG